MFDDKDFLRAYRVVKPLIFRLRQLYHIHLWTEDDWCQEGKIALFQLLHQEPKLLTDDQRLRVYFKTKFSNIIKDRLREQQSLKRRFNQMPYMEIHDCANLIKADGLSLEDLVIFREIERFLRPHLSSEEHKGLQALMAGPISSES